MEQLLEETPKVKDAVFSEEENSILLENRKLRRVLTNLLTTDETGKTVLPKGTADKALLAQLIDGMDKEATTRAKLRIAVKANDNAANLTALAARTLIGHKVPVRKPSSPEQRALPSDVQVPDIVPGETDIGVTTFTLETILGEK
jgi:regulator of replication initiation timing